MTSSDKIKSLVKSLGWEVITNGKEEGEEEEEKKVPDLKANRSLDSENLEKEEKIYRRSSSRYASRRFHGKHYSNGITSREAFDKANPGITEFLTNHKSHFGQEMLIKLNKYGYLTENQLAAVKRMMNENQAGEMVNWALDLSKVKELLDKAYAEGERRPTYSYENLVFTRAPNSGSNPGAVYIRRDNEYLGKWKDGRYQGSKESKLNQLAEEIKRLIK